MKEQFLSDNTLEKTTYSYVSDYNARFSQRIQTDFELAQFQIVTHFEKFYGTENRYKDLA